MRVVLLLIFISSIVSTQVQARCILAQQSLVPHDELINRTNNIVLARVQDAIHIPRKNRAHAESPTHIFSFKVIRNIKGELNEIPNIDGVAAKYYDKESANQITTYNNHEDERFWGITKPSLFRTSCVPSFAIGHEYLIFLSEQPYHVNSFEQIDAYIKDSPFDDNKYDKWLSYVEEKVAKK